MFNRAVAKRRYAAEQLPETQANSKHEAAAMEWNMR